VRSMQWRGVTRGGSSGAAARRPATRSRQPPAGTRGATDGAMPPHRCTPRAGRRPGLRLHLFRDVRAVWGVEHSAAAGRRRPAASATATAADAARAAAARDGRARAPPVASPALHGAGPPRRRVVEGALEPLPSGKCVSVGGPPGRAPQMDGRLGAGEGGGRRGAPAAPDADLRRTATRLNPVSTSPENSETPAP